MPLVFETALPLIPAAPQRTDIACFIGYVARRDTPLPLDVVDELRAAGRIGGPWQAFAPALHALEQLPVTVANWDAFDRLFDWRARPVGTGDTARCASYLGAAVRRFFAQGGQRAVIVRTGDPWPYLAPAGSRAANRIERLRRIVPTMAANGIPARPFDSADPRTWRGIEHVYALPAVSLVCMPDLADVCALDPLPPDDAPPRPDVAEGFVECSEREPEIPIESALHRIDAPRCNAEGLRAWVTALGAARDFAVAHRRDVVLVNALPLTDAPLAQRDPRRFLEEATVLRAEGAEARATTSAFVQLAYPWLATREARDLPRGIEPPDGMLAGLIAAGALARGTFRSVAGTRLPAVLGTHPIASWGHELSNPWARLAERICLVAQEPGGFALQSDVTTSASTAWRAGGVTRMMASVLRAARATGETELFGPNGPALWTRVRRQLESLLTDYWQQGGLGGATPNEAFEVRCDRSTMTQNDLDNGRLIARIAVLPVAAIDRIIVVMALTAGGNLAADIREVA